MKAAQRTVGENDLVGLVGYMMRQIESGIKRFNRDEVADGSYS